jgi:hypothetical protein
MGRRGCWIYKLPMQSVPITTNIVNLNPVKGEVHLIQHYVVKFFERINPEIYVNSNGWKLNG